MLGCQCYEDFLLAYWIILDCDKIVVEPINIDMVISYMYIRFTIVIRSVAFGFGSGTLYPNLQSKYSS